MKFFSIFSRTKYLLLIVLGTVFSGYVNADLQASYRRASDYLPWRVSTWITFHHTDETLWSAQGDKLCFQTTSPDGNYWTTIDTSSLISSVTNSQPDFSISPETSSTISPNGQYGIGQENYNLWFVNKSGHKSALTNNGTQSFGYAPDFYFGLIGEAERLALQGSMRPARGIWSPDSRYFVTYRYDQTQLGAQYYWHTVTNQGYGRRPEMIPQLAPYPGEPNAKMELVIIDSKRKKVKPVPDSTSESFFDPIYQGELQWSDDGGHLYFLREGVGLRSVTLNRLDVKSGNSEVLYQQTSPTYLALSGSRYPAIWHVLKNEQSAIWFSEHTGWGNLYLIDLNSGTIKYSITQGKGVVDSVLRIDESDGWIYFTATGRTPGVDPYYQQLFRARIDGQGVETLTPEPIDHIVSLPPSGSVFLDTQTDGIASSPRAILRELNSGNEIKTIVETDLTQLQQRWSEPERVRVRDANDEYDIYLTLFRPSDFDPGKTYPLLDYVYGPPNQIQNAPSFPVTPEFGYGMEYWQAQAMAEIGFFVTIIDAPGTPHRGYEFARKSYGEAGFDVGLSHHISAIKQLKTQYPQIDMQRIGIFGNSGGGYTAARGMLLYPDFFKVGVAGSGVHDIIRAQSPEWGERYYGPIESNKELYRKMSNTTYADRLQGHLLLMHGEADDEVSITMTQQFVHALIAANKDFDLLYIPGMTHYTSSNRYFVRKRWDYFVQHLKEQNPPKDFLVPGAYPGDQNIQIF